MTNPSKDIAGSKLPEIVGSMPLVQGLLLETYRVLIAEGIMTEEKAVARYLDMKKTFGNPHTSESWDLYDH